MNRPQSGSRTFNQGVCPMAMSPTYVQHGFERDEPRCDAKLWRNAGQREENARAKRQSRQALEKHQVRITQQSDRYRRLRKQQRYNAKLYRIARRLPAIIRVKHGGILYAPANYAAMLFVQGGALKDPTWGDPAMRQRLIEDAIDYAVHQGVITRARSDGMVSLSIHTDEIEDSPLIVADPLLLSKLICRQSIVKELAYH